MSASEKLLNITTSDGWTVIEKIATSANSTGGTFSQSYLVRNGDRIGFMKAFDFSSAFEAGVTGKETLDRLRSMISSYEHERDVLEYCGVKRMSNVVTSLGHGDIQVPDLHPTEGRVYYLIFEKAEGDVRVQMDAQNANDALWCMKALKDISLGLWQVHREMIAHQDAKPSNVLLYGKDAFKISDFGRSSRKGAEAPHDGLRVAGDVQYSPPELLYGYTDPDFSARRIGCDLYMLGNLAAFLFTGANITSMLLSRLDPQFHHTRWAGTYHEALPYLQSAFSQVIVEVSDRIDIRVRDTVMKIISELCNPDLSKRGHPRGIGNFNQYSLERYVSQLDRAAKILELKIRTSSAA